MKKISVILILVVVLGIVSYYLAVYLPEKSSQMEREENIKTGDSFQNNGNDEFHNAFLAQGNSSSVITDEEKFVPSNAEEAEAYNKGYESAKNETWKAGRPLDISPPENVNNMTMYAIAYMSGYSNYCIDAKKDCSDEDEVFYRIWARLMALMKFMDNPHADENRVERYGILMELSTAGSMKFRYYDIDQDKVYENWNGYPWFWAGKYNDAAEIDNFIRYMNDHEKYVFKITGFRAEDDCAYLPDGNCLEDIEIDTIEAIKESAATVDEITPPAYYDDGIAG